MKSKSPEEGRTMEEDDDRPNYLSGDLDDMDGWVPTWSLRIDTVLDVWQKSEPFLTKLAASKINSEGVWPNKFGIDEKDEEGAMIFHDCDSKEQSHMVKNVIAIISFLVDEKAIHVHYTTPSGEVTSRDVYGEERFDVFSPRPSDLFKELIESRITKSGLDYIKPELIAAFTSWGLGRYKSEIEANPRKAEEYEAFVQVLDYNLGLAVDRLLEPIREFRAQQS